MRRAWHAFAENLRAAFFVVGGARHKPCPVRFRAGGVTKGRRCQPKHRHFPPTDERKQGRRVSCMIFTPSDMFACPVCMPSTLLRLLTLRNSLPYPPFDRTTAVTVTLIGKLEISTFYEPATKTSKVSGHELWKRVRGGVRGVRGNELGDPLGRRCGEFTGERKGGNSGGRGEAETPRPRVRDFVCTL